MKTPDSIEIELGPAPPFREKTGNRTKFILLSPGMKRRSHWGRPGISGFEKGFKTKFVFFLLKTHEFLHCTLVNITIL